MYLLPSSREAVLSQGDELALLRRLTLGWKMQKCICSGSPRFCDWQKHVDGGSFTAGLDIKFSVEIARLSPAFRTPTPGVRLVGIPLPLSAILPLHSSARPILECIGAGELSPEEQDLRRVVDPDQKNHD
jgi:hypothetical protein